MKLDPHLTPYTKINSKSIEDLNISPKTIKILEEILVVVNFFTSVLTNFFGFDTKSKATKPKTNKCDFMKLRTFYTTKGNHRQNEKPTYGME